MTTQEIHAVAQESIGSRFVAEVESDGCDVWLTVRHENQSEDYTCCTLKLAEIEEAVAEMQLRGLSAK